MSELPNIIKNQNNSDISYELGKFLGKGGFAKCYEFRQVSDGKVYAGKIVPKTLLKVNSSQKFSLESFLGLNVVLITFIIDIRYASF